MVLEVQDLPSILGRERKRKWRLILINYVISADAMEATTRYVAMGIQTSANAVYNTCYAQIEAKVV